MIIFDAMLRRLKYIYIVFLLCTNLTKLGAQDYFVSNIYVYGNKHTSYNVINREISIQAGKTYNIKTLEKEIKISEENLNNTSFFNTVSITYSRDTTADRRYVYSSDSLNCYKNPQEIANLGNGAEAVSLNITVTERWYYWPNLDIVFEDRNMSSWVNKFDMNRITIGYGLTTQNFLGQGHKVTLSGKTGFKKGLNFSYKNIAVDQYRKHFLSFDMGFLKTKTAECYTEKNKPVSFKSNGYMEKNWKVGASYTYRHNIRKKLTFGAEFSHNIINDTILIVNSNYWGSDATIMNRLKFTYTYEYDQRDYQTYPTSGFYTKLEGRADIAINDPFKYGQITANLQYYKPLGGRWYYSSDFKGGLSVKTDKAWIYDRAIGDSKIAMSTYDIFVIDGQHFITHNSTLRYLILPKKEFYLRWFSRLDKFSHIHFTMYGKILFEMGYAYNNDNSRDNCYTNSFLCGVGAGIDILTYYDIILNCGYVINKTGHRCFIFGLKAPLF